MNPRAGCPAYRISNPNPSASWVHLQNAQNVRSALYNSLLILATFLEKVPAAAPGCAYCKSRSLTRLYFISPSDGRRHPAFAYPLGRLGLRAGAQAYPNLSSLTDFEDFCSLSIYEMSASFSFSLKYLYRSFRLSLRKHSSTARSSIVSSAS